MVESKLIFLLKTFKKSEWRRFREFLASPFFNKRKDLLAFYQCIEETAPLFAAEKLEKEVVFKKIYGQKAYDDKQMRYLMNYTLKAAEQFMGYQRFECSNQLDNYILEELVNRKLEKHSKRYFENISKKQKDKEEYTDDRFYAQYKFMDIANKHFINQDLRRDDQNLKLASEKLDTFYFYNKLKYSCEMLNRQSQFSSNYDLAFTKLLYNHLEQSSEIQEPLIAIYAQIYALSTKEDAKNNFEKLKHLIREHNQYIPSTEKRHIYSFAINYCSRQIKHNKNPIYFVRECLALYLVGIQQEFLFINGYLSPWYFKNVVKLGFNLKRYDWTAAFIQDYHKKLAPTFQEDALHYNLADLAYRKGNHEKAQLYLLKVAYSDVFYTLGAKTMLLKIYYENNELESLLSLIASFSIYLKRNKKIGKNYRDTYLNFTSLLHQVTKAKKGKTSKILEKIYQTELLSNRRWLLEVCQQKMST